MWRHIPLSNISCILSVNPNSSYFQAHSQSTEVPGQVTTPPSTSPPTFSPIVTATCRAGIMKVKVETLEPFVGVVQSRDYRKPECSAYGEKTTVTYLRINLLAESDETNYCGTFITSVSTLLYNTISTLILISSILNFPILFPNFIPPYDTELSFLFPRVISFPFSSYSISSFRPSNHSISSLVRD